MPQPNKIIFAAEQVAYLKENYLKVSPSEMAIELNRPIRHIYGKLYRLKLTKNQQYTDGEIEIVKEHFKTMGNKEIGEMIGRSADSVKHIMKRLNLKRTAHEVTLLAKKFNTGQFIKNGKCYNLKEKFTISIRKDKNGHYYKYIKLADKHWKLLHRHNWEKEHGEIPEGYNVVFKDGDSMNCEPENLECISKEENMLRNSFVQYPRQIIPLKVLTNKLQKIITEKSR